MSLIWYFRFHVYKIMFNLYIFYFYFLHIFNCVTFFVYLIHENIKIYGCFSRYWIKIDILRNIKQMINCNLILILFIIVVMCCNNLLSSRCFYFVFASSTNKLFLIRSLSTNLSVITVGKSFGIIVILHHQGSLLQNNHFKIFINIE